MRVTQERIELDGVNVDVTEYKPKEDEGNTTFVFRGPSGGQVIEHGIILKAPSTLGGKPYRDYEIQYINVIRDERERLFALLDEELHGETYKDLNDENSRLRDQLEEAESQLAYYKENAI